MKLAIVGAGSIRDSLLFESYMKKAIDFFESPIDEIVVDGNARKGVRFLAERFADEHGITLIISPTKNVSDLSDGLYILWHGKGEGLVKVFRETQIRMKPIFEVRLDYDGLNIGRHNEQTQGKVFR